MSTLSTTHASIASRTSEYSCPQPTSRDTAQIYGTAGISTKPTRIVNLPPLTPHLNPPLNTDVQYTLPPLPPLTTDVHTNCPQNTQTNKTTHERSLRVRLAEDPHGFYDAAPREERVQGLRRGVRRDVHSLPCRAVACRFVTSGNGKAGVAIRRSRPKSTTLYHTKRRKRNGRGCSAPSREALATARYLSLQLCLFVG